MQSLPVRLKKGSDLHNTTPSLTLGALPVRLKRKRSGDEDEHESSQAPKRPQIDSEQNIVFAGHQLSWTMQISTFSRFCSIPVDDQLISVTHYNPLAIELAITYFHSRPLPSLETLVYHYGKPNSLNKYTPLLLRSGVTPISIPAKAMVYCDLAILAHRWGCHPLVCLATHLFRTTLDTDTIGIEADIMNTMWNFFEETKLDYLLGCELTRILACLAEERELDRWHYRDEFMRMRRMYKPLQEAWVAITSSDRQALY